MLKVHQDKIISNLAVLVEKTNLNTLVPELLNRNVFNERMINRILNPSHSNKRQKTDLYVELLKRGPQAFDKLQDALVNSNHSYLAELLLAMDPTVETSQIHRSSSLNSIGSSRSQNSSSCEIESENDGPCFSQCRNSNSQIKNSTKTRSFTETMPSSSSTGQTVHSQENLGKSCDFNDLQLPSCDPENKVFNLPAYSIEYIDHTIKSTGLISPVDKINYDIEINRPVKIKQALQWQSQIEGKPRLYKMDSNPRGYALLINNKKFYNRVEYSDRLGSDNDVKRMMQLLKQLYFVVHFYENKTKTEMEALVKSFSQNQDLNHVDCAIAIFMSHGQSGETDEDSEILGVDGVGYKTEEIISQFYNDCCRALINKPKLFLFQACRGNLMDPGVTIGRLYLGSRIATDGKKNIPARDIKIRTHSDIFVAYPVTAGRQANRDFITGAWFMQAIVDVFSEHAWNNNLEDLFKLVDEKIKRMNNLHTLNFQTVTIKTMGWNKNLYFNPGLYRDKITKETIRESNSSNTVPMDEGLDVVDTAKSNPGKSAYFRLRNNGNDEDQENNDKNYGCFPGCSTS